VLIDNVTDSFAPLITQVELETVSIDELSLMLHKSERFDMLKRISRCRKRTTQLSRLLTTKADVMKSLIKRYDEKWQRAGGYGAFLVDLPIEEVTALKTLNEVLLHLGDIQGKYHSAPLFTFYSLALFM
jgi:Mg2+ and Co2+ transporter CorA